MSHSNEVTGYCTTCPKCLQRYSWKSPAFPIPPCPQCNPAKKDRRDAQPAKPEQPQKADAMVEEALSMAEEIEDLAGQLPAEGEDFGMSVMEKASDIAKNIEAHGRVTDAQYNALSNMLSGLEKWFND